jgi:hypothetical protein
MADLDPKGEGNNSMPEKALLLFLWVGSGALRRVRGRSSQVIPEGAGSVNPVFE